ncbi:MAG: MFS transporter [Halobacteria archaeon]
MSRLPKISYSGRILVVLSLGWATLQCGRFLLPPLLPRITETLGFSPAGIGAALTAFGLIYAVTQYPSGTYSDSLSRATLIVPGFVVLLAGFVAVGLAFSKLFLIGGLLALGVGKGVYASPSRALVGDLFTARRGRAMGIYSAGTDVGGFVASGLAVLVLATATWRIGFLPVVIVLTGTTALYVVWNREGYEVSGVELSPGETAERIASTKNQREILIAFSLFYFFVGGLTNFLPTLLVSGGFSDTVASASFALLFATGFLTKPLAGEVSDRYPRLLVAAGALLVAVIGVSLILLAPALPAVAAGTVMTAVGYKTLFPISDTILMDTAPDAAMGGDMGAARAVFLTANAAGPGVVGVIAEVSNFETAFWVLVASLIISIGVLWRLYRRLR